MQYTFKLINSVNGKVYYPSIQSAHQLSSNTRRLQTESTARMLDGSSERASMSWERASFSIHGAGTMPPGLDSLNKAVIYAYHSFQSRSESIAYEVTGTTTLTLTATSITNILPFGVRVDAGYAPFLYVAYADGTTQSYEAYTSGTTTRTYSCVVKSSDIDSVTEVYFPIHDVYTAPPTIDFDGRSGTYGWTLELEMV